RRLGEKIQDDGMTEPTDRPPAAAAPVAAAIEVALPGLPTLRGQRWGEGEPVAVLLHEPGTDLDAWGSLPALLARRLEAAVDALDLPGHGLSDDPWLPARLPEAVAAITRRWAAAGGAPAIIAAGDTAWAALTQAAALGPAAVVALSPAGIDPGALASARSPLVPKLIFAGALDGDAVATARQAANALGGWAAVSSVPTAERGTAILAGRWGESVADHIAGFLREAIVRRR
ncbi:MAG TPA: hypothetical protein VFI22_07145, partial [Thermomicrobiales bacterium]|nr:hypothetical protein [Thermomicrobiales bacterium]